VNDLLAAVEVTQVFPGKIAQGREMFTEELFKLNFQYPVVGGQLSELGFIGYWDYGISIPVLISACSQDVAGVQLPDFVHQNSRASLVRLICNKIMQTPGIPIQTISACGLLFPEYQIKQEQNNNGTDGPGEDGTHPSGTQMDIKFTQ